MVAFASAINIFFLLLDYNGGLILKNEVDVTHLMSPDRAEVHAEVSDTFDKYIRELQADRDWEAGAYRDDPAHARRPTNFLVWRPEVYTGTESYADNRDVLDTIDSRVGVGPSCRGLCAP